MRRSYRSGVLSRFHFIFEIPITLLDYTEPEESVQRDGLRIAKLRVDIYIGKYTIQYY